MEIVNFMEDTNQKENNSKANFRISNRIDYDSTFKSLSRTLSSHAEGLRELAKNSENAMIGNKVAPKHTGRDCILLFSQRKSAKDVPLIGFLDFIGFDRSRVEKFEVLNKSDAALYSHTKKEDARGGHGNGGKVYGAFHFEEASWHTCLNNKYNKLTYETNYGKARNLGLKIFEEQHGDEDLSNSCFDEAMIEHVRALVVEVQRPVEQRHDALRRAHEAHLGTAG